MNDQIKSLATKLINASTKIQEADRFNVRFLGMEKNISDFLSRQVRSVSPRILTFDQVRTSNRRSSFPDLGKIQNEQFELQFVNDSNSLTRAILIDHIAHQNQRPKFDIKIEYMNESGDITQYELYRKCLFTIMSTPEYTTLDGLPVALNTSIVFDSVDYYLNPGDDETEVLLMSSTS